MTNNDTLFNDLMKSTTKSIPTVLHIPMTCHLFEIIEIIMKQEYHVQGIKWEEGFA